MNETNELAPRGPAYEPRQDHRRLTPAPPTSTASPELRIAVINAAARIVAGPQSSHLIQDPDIAQGVAASFRTVYDAIMEAVSGVPGE